MAHDFGSNDTKLKASVKQVLLILVLQTDQPAASAFATIIFGSHAILLLLWSILCQS